MLISVEKSLFTNDANGFLYMDNWPPATFSIEAVYKFYKLCKYDMRQLMKNPGNSFQPPVQCKERPSAEGASTPPVTQGVGHYILSKL